MTLKLLNLAFLKMSIVSWILPIMFNENIYMGYINHDTYQLDLYLNNSGNLNFISYADEKIIHMIMFNFGNIYIGT